MHASILILRVPPKFDLRLLFMRAVDVNNDGEIDVDSEAMNLDAGAD